MNWINALSKAIEYIEDNLTDKINLDEISRQAFSSDSHFQLIFHLVTGLTVGEYIRNRRLSLAAHDLREPHAKIIDVAMRYQYDTPEGFSKAFTRFHGVAPSKIKGGRARVFNPFTINISIQGGFEMSWKIADEFLLLDWVEIKEQGELSPEEKYKQIAAWAGAARGRNPKVFDALCDWLKNDDEWKTDKLPENEQILIQGVFAQFKDQNARLRAYLKELEPSGVVNPPVFKALDEFDNALNGVIPEYLSIISDSIRHMFTDFSCMLDSCVRKDISGDKTGAHGSDTVEHYGFCGHLKNLDAHVQWTLFMPDWVKKQQQNFQVNSFEYKTLPAMRFIGKETGDHESMEWRRDLFDTLDKMREYKSEFNHDVMFCHHYGKGVNIEPWHGFWGRFMKAGTPVPDGFIFFDLVPDDTDTPYLTFRSQFAYATFSGDLEAMHKREGYDGDAMYDITRNIILGQGVTIPYPEIYWTAEVFIGGACDDWSTAYMFSVTYDNDI
ncbi:MAG: AraC family transcriptional regulator [Defluviitaleaceae bacterium]|nr:AraC family transcriptional regulator [Defluviitaleaceae bacterium]